MARVIPNRTDGEGPRESLMITNTTLCDLRSFVRSLACARDDKPIYRHLSIPNPGRENPDRGTQLRDIRLNGNRKLRNQSSLRLKLVFGTSVA